MLKTFTVENFKSIRELQTLSMEAGKGDHLEWSNVIATGRHRLLKSAAIYGPNASGKSNVIQAMTWFSLFVLNSSREGQRGDSIDIDPFLLHTEWADRPTHFEVEFLVGDWEYRYGFTVSNEEVVSEWLFRRELNGGREVRLFTREGQEISASPKYFKEGRGLEERTRSEALFVSVCAQLNGEISGEILEWVAQFRFASGLSESAFFSFTARRLQSKESRSEIEEFSRNADLGIRGIESSFQEVDEESLPPGLTKETRAKLLKNKPLIADITTIHAVINGKGKIVEEIEFDLKDDESQGTQKFIALTGPILFTLEQGSILIVDELEARLHPRLTQAIVDLFHSPANRKNAQLIFATHDVTLMEPDRFRREQILFCEKNEEEATQLYCLADFDSDLVRPTSKFSRQYLKGLFGAVPSLAHFESSVIHATSEES